MNRDNFRYIFFYLSPNIGGAQLLFARIAEAIIKQGNEVLIVEQEQSFIHKFLIERKIDIHVIQVSEPNKIQLKENDLLVLSLSYIFLFKRFIQPHINTRIVFWDLHPYALIEATAFSKFHKNLPESWISSLMLVIEKQFINKIRAFITIANKQNALFFMCLRNYNTNNRLFNLNIEPKYLPIPISLNNEFIDINKNNSAKIIRLGWISRMDEDKIAILELLIKDIIKFNCNNSKQKIQLHAIGNGNNFEKMAVLKKELGEVMCLPGLLYGSELSKYLAKNVDIGFSMGTASLEFAIRKIPTVLVPGATWYKLFKKEQNRYIWLHEISGYDIAVNKFHLNYSSTDFETIIKTFISKRQYLSEKSYKYVLQNHSFKNVFQQFYKLSSSSTFTYSDLSKTGIYKHGFFQNFIFLMKKTFKKFDKK